MAPKNFDPAAFERSDDGQLFLGQLGIERLAFDALMEYLQLSELVILTNSAFVDSWKIIPGLVGEEQVLFGSISITCVSRLRHDFAIVRTGNIRRKSLRKILCASSDTSRDCHWMRLSLPLQVLILYYLHA